MSEELLSNGQAGEKLFDHVRIRTNAVPRPNLKHFPLGYQALLSAMIKSILF